MDAVLLACFAGFTFGSLGPALRAGLTRTGDAELGAFHSTALALPVAFAVAAAAGALDDVSLSELWPFAVLGLVVPGISQVLFVRAIRDVGASRTMIITGMAPLFASLAALAFLDEPFRVALLAGTLLVVVGIVALAWDRTRPEGFRAVGILWALSGVVLFAARDVLARWISEGREAPGVLSAVALFAGASGALLVYLLVVRRGQRPLTQIARTARPFLLAGVVFGVGYCALFEAFDRGRVTVVSPLNGTYALWAVVVSALVMRRAEAITVRVGLAALLVVAGGAVVGATR